MADKKVYTIEINGVKQSTDAVQALNKMFIELESRIQALEKKSISINTTSSITSSSGSRGSNTSALSEEEKLAKQIEQIDAKRVAYGKEIYQNYLAAKDVLSETVNDQKQISAQERLQANTYTHTMASLKQQMADLKTVLNTTDIGSAEFDKISKKIGEINNELKGLEQSYGQFGRNVGNYDQVNTELGKLQVQVGNVSREFSSAREASRTLREELYTLELQGKGNTEEADNLRKAYYNLQSAMDDATKTSKAMDEAMDWMQSFTSLSSMGNGLKAFFGFDNNEITRSIQKLVALQGVLQGLEILRKQMQTSEGFGKLLTKGSESVDSFVASITGAQKGINGLTLGSRAATIAVRGLSLALKGLGVGIILSVITSALSGLESLSTKVQSYFKGNAAIANTTDAITSAIEAENNAFKAQQNILSTNYLRGYISDLQYAQDSAWNLTNAIKSFIAVDMHEMLANMKNVSSVYGDFIASLNGGLKNGIKIESDILDFGDTTVKTLDAAKEAWNRYYKAVEANENVLENERAWYDVLGWFGQLTTTLDDTKDDFVSAGQIIAGDWMRRMSQIDRSTLDTKEGINTLRGQLKPLIDEFNNDAITRSVLMNLDKYFPDQKLIIKMQNVVEYAQVLAKGLDFMYGGTDTQTAVDGANYWEQVRIDSLKKGAEKIRAQIALNAKKEKDELIKQYGSIPEFRLKEIDAKYARQLEDQLAAEGKRRSNDAKKRTKELEEAEKELRQLKIAQMKNGFEKEKAQLEEERRERISKLNQMEISTKKKQEILVQINTLYDKKILEAKRDWSYNMVKTYEDMYSRIEQLTKSTFNTEVDTASSNVESRRYNEKENVSLVPQMVMPPSENITQYETYYKKIIDIEEKASERQSKIEQEKLANEYQFNKEEEELRHKRQVSIETSNAVLTKLQEYENSHNGIPMTATASEAEWKRLEDQMKKSLEGMRGTLVDAYNNGEISFKDFCKLVENEQAAHNSKMNALEKQYAAQSKENEDQLNKEKLSHMNSYYSSMINIVKRNEDEISKITESTPKTDKYGWDIVNIKATSQAYKQSIDGYKDLTKNIAKMKGQLKKDLDSKKISHEDFLMRDQELNEALKRVNDSIKQTEQQQKKLIGDFMQSISTYIQAGVESFQTIMSAVWDAQDAQFDKQQEALDKLNEELDEKLRKQEEIVTEHKSNIDSIEDELATSRGDRRQHLIDQLNAEIAAQRAAQKEEQRIQKEKEAAQKKQDALDLKRKKAEYKRNMLQAIVNGAMAVTMAAINSWPIPAIPMMALAASTTAAQIAIMASNKPYAKGGQLDGGVAVGNLHRDGGIKVLGGRAEIEGGEFITNRQTTARNIDLLEYINSKKKRIDISDLIDFYTTTPRKTIKGIKTRYEDGGYIPTIPNALDVRDQLQNVIINQDNRPIYVSVVDINNKQEDVRRVQALAGL